MVRIKTPEQLVYTGAQAADAVGEHRNTIYLAVKEGKLRASRRGQHLRISRDDLMAYALGKDEE